MAFTVQLPDLPGSKRNMPPRIPLASYRHAGPSGPWPWADLVEDDSVPFLQIPDKQASDLQAQGHSWRKYPTQLFPNWNGNRLLRSGIAGLVHKSTSKSDPNCVIYYVDVQKDGQFSEAGQYMVQEDNPEEFLSTIKEAQEKQNRVKLLFVENLSGTALQILGTMYKIEPFFFSSSLNWIPSRYQEGLENDGDHITITLTFLRAMPNPMTEPNTPASGTKFFAQMLSRAGTATIDTQAPLILRSNDRILLLDLLALHMIRRKDGSTIISYHPTREWKSTSALYLRTRVGHAGKSVYWQSLFQRSEDPTLVLLSILWYALYAWDEALENLYMHISYLESRVLEFNDIHLTRELHIIRARLLHYTSLLQSFRKAVLFIRNTPNPAIDGKSVMEESIRFMDRECDTLISEIDRLEMFRGMQDMRLENVINLAFSIVNLEDSRHTQSLSEASLRDSAVMKQISYMTMIFFPASFVSSAFGMNITNLEDGSYATLAQYFAVAIPLTVFTVWVMLALHKKNSQQQSSSLFDALQWPIRSMRQLYNKRYQKKNEAVV